MSHCQDKNKEDLFRLLRRSDGKEFEEDVIKNWYRARNYVLKVLGEHDVFDDMVQQKKKVNVVLEVQKDQEETSGLMMSVARQIALLVHYPTFDDATTVRNRTVITILFDKKVVETHSVIDFVSKEEYLCNLPKYCKCTVWNFGDETGKTVNGNSFLDIELELIVFDRADFGRYDSADALRIKAACIQDKVFEETIDLSMAKRTNMVYNVGADIDNLPPDNPNTAERYDRALLYFCYQQSPEDTQKVWNKIENSQTKIRNKLSNVFCSDCFPYRLKYVLNKDKKDGDETVCGISLAKYVTTRYQKVLSVVKDNLEALARCEHARWNVEKLLLGFRPLSDEEHLKDERLFGKERKAYRSSLKDNGIHIDLCSYRDLRRINPGDMKYDCFLMIAMPRILLESFGSRRVK